MKTAREVAHAHEAFYEDCPGPLPSSSGHSHSCDRLTAAIEARDREVEANCAHLVREFSRPHWTAARHLEDTDDVEAHEAVAMALEDAAKMLRSLAPPPGGTK